MNSPKIFIGIDARSLEGQRTGVGRYLMNLLKYWAKKSIELNIELILYFKNKIPDDIPKSKNFQKKALNNKSNALFTHYHLPRAAKKDKVDILFCPAYVAPIFYKGKIALTLHDIIYQARPDLYNWPSIFDKILLKKVSKISAKKAEIIFTPSNFSKKEIIKYYEVNPRKVFVTPLAPDRKFKNVGYPVSHIKKGYGVGSKFIFYVGAINNRRFIPETIKAFAKAADKLSDYQLLIAGPNYTQPFVNIDNLIKKANQEIGREAILHKDYIKDEDLVFLYNEADLFIWLSSYEGFGLPPLEALACGTPVITIKTGSLPEAVGDAAIFVKNPEDIDEISQAIYRGLTNKNLREELIKKGLVQAQKFSWQKTAEKTLDILLNYEQR